MSHLSEHLMGRIREQALPWPDLARSVGYANVNKFCRRLQRFETSGEIDPPLLVKLAGRLGVAGETIAALVERDRHVQVAEMERWADEPVQPELVARLIAGFFATLTLPPHAIATLESAEAFAAAEARRLRCRVWLVWSRRLTIALDANGEAISREERVVGSTSAPRMTLRGSRRPLTVDLNSFRPKLLDDHGGQGIPRAS